MNIIKRYISLTVARVREVIQPDFGADHYPLHTYSHVRHPDYRQDGLPNQPRGNQKEDFLGGVPQAQHPNATLAGFPRRSTMVAFHGWRIPTPPQLPVYD